MKICALCYAGCTKFVFIDNFVINDSNYKIIRGFHWLVYAGMETSTLYAPLAQALRTEIKFLRTKPIETQKRLLNKLSYFHGKEFKQGTVAKCTKEGAKVIQEAIGVLKSASGGLTFDDQDTHVSLSLAAQDHAAYIGSAGLVSHTGINGTLPHERIEQYAKWILATGEVIWYGTIDFSDKFEHLAQNIIDDLFVDDGVASRGHRLGWFLHIPLLYPCISPHDHCIC